MQEVKQDPNTSDPIPTAISMDPRIPIALTVLMVFAASSSVLVFKRLRNRNARAKPERTLPQQ